MRDLVWVQRQQRFYYPEKCLMFEQSQTIPEIVAGALRFEHLSVIQKIEMRVKKVFSSA